MSCVLHVSADYPDACQPNTTPVIRRLVNALSEYSRNVVVSIHRVNRPSEESAERSGDVFSIRYFSPPFGILQSFYLDRLAKRIIDLVERAGIRPTVAIGHKFTIESYVVSLVAGHFGIRYVAAFMGNSDRKIFQMKPHYRQRYRRIANAASAIVFPTPWCRDYFERRLLQPSSAKEAATTKVIPYISAEHCAPRKLSPRHAKHFVVICRLDVWRIKNLHRLIEAVALLRRESLDWKLDIVGAGSEAAETVVRHLIGKSNIADGVRMLGAMGREQIDAILPTYSAMVLPSYPETFGLVYLEALVQGVPIMTARNSGFDGYFADEFPGVVVSHDSIDDIKMGLTQLADRSEHYRDVIARSAEELSRFDRKTIVDGYRTLLGV